jgi:hypothetical protein
MKFRLTPLNFFSAFFILLTAYIWIVGGNLIAGRLSRHINGSLAWIFLLFAFVVSFLDLIFRNFFPQTKRLWLVELSFITLTIVIYLLIR